MGYRNSWLLLAQKLTANVQQDSTHFRGQIIGKFLGLDLHESAGEVHSYLFDVVFYAHFHSRDV